MAHIRKIHTNKRETEKRKHRDDEHEEGNGERDKRMFEKYVGVTASTIPLETLLNYGTNRDLKRANEVIVEQVPDEGKMEEEEDIAAIKAENTELKATVATLKIEIETKQELLEAKTGRCDALEEEKIINTEKKNTLHGVAGQIFAELEELKKAGLTADVKKKLKKANDGLKNAEKNLEESIKQCGIEANKRASAEAELTRNAGLVDLMTRTVTMMMCQVGGLGGAAGPAQGMADQRQQAAASCQGQWLGGGAGLSTGMGGAPASTTWMDGQQINRVGGVTGPSQGMAGQGHWMGGVAGPTTGMAGQT